MYVHETHTYKVLDNHFKFDTWEYQTVKITGGGTNKDIIIINIYRPPNDIQQHYKTFIDEFAKLLSCFDKSNSEIIITGDLNIDLLKINQRPIFSEFYDILTANSYLPKITLPTRFTETSGTLIDNFFCKLTNITIESVAGILTKKFSDHQPYFILLNAIIEKPHMPKYIQIRVQSEYAFNNFKKGVQSSNIYDSLDNNSFANPNNNYNILINKLTQEKEIHMPDKIVKFKKHKHKKTTWITTGIIKSIKYRDNLYLRLKHTDPNTATYLDIKTNLRTYNSILKKSIREAKRIHFSRIFIQCENNIKKTWNTINKIIRKTANNNSIHNDLNVREELDSNILKANKFNTFFTEIGPKLANSITVTNNTNHNDYLKTEIDTVFQFQQVDENDILNIINNLTPKTSSGIDNLSIKHIKVIKYELAKPLTLITNQVLSSGIFPDKLKIAKVIPIFKKGDDTDVNNYRPISLLPVISKIIEKVIYNQTYNYFDQNKILYAHQYGFRKQHSTELAVLELVDRTIYTLDKDETPINIFLDLSKAFDTLNHTILLTKLHHYGIRDGSLNLFKSYLQNRKQYVVINNAKSETVDITTGVPQGSILGPLLFIIYINDLPNASNIFHSIMYADDTNLSASLQSIKSTNPNETVDTLINKELSKISEWLGLNKLSLNVKKSKYIVHKMTNKKVDNLQLNVNGIAIEKVYDFNFLGLTLNENINWKNHIEKIAIKSSKIIGILNKLKYILPTQIKVLLYNTLLLPHINYCILSWGYKCDRITKIQKRAIRLINLSKYNAHTEPIFKQFKLLKVNHILQMQEFKFYHKFKNNTLPAYLQHLNLLPNSSIHSHNTRGKTDLHIHRTTHTFAKQCLRQNIPVLLNNAPSSITDKFLTHSIQGFSNYVNNHFVNKYQQHCTIPNCYICQL